jgi:hypothetical protein
MNQRRIDWLAAGIIFITAMVVYLLTVSPTVAFWDVGEFIACSVNLGVPHPPGTPLYVLIGRIFALLPISAETAFRINFISVLTAALSAAMVVLITSRVTRSFKKSDVAGKMKWVPTAVGVVGALFTMTAFSVWENALEAEVYAPSALIGLLIVYLAIVWRERTEHAKEKSPTSVKIPKADNRLMLLVFYIIMLAAGIHLTPVMMLFALIPFIMMVNHRLLPTFFFGVFGLSFMLFEPGWPQIAVISLFVVYFFVQAAGSRKGYGPAFAFLGAYGLLIALVALTTGPVVVIGGALVLVAAFFYAGKKYDVDLKFFLLGALLLIIAASVQFYLMVRAAHHPSINMVNPSSWDRFLSVLRREQYGRATVQNQIWPRKTVVHPDTGQPTGVSVIAGIFWQVVFYFKYFFWQWGLQNLAGKSVFTVITRTLLAAVPIILGVFGLYSLAKRDRKLFWLLLTAFLVSSFGLVVYLNMRFGHTGPLPGGMTGLPQEVRERDYFFTFSYVFWGLFTGFGLFEIIASLKESLRKIAASRIVGIAACSVAAVLTVVIGFINLPLVSRRNDWIPLEYGFNLLASCEEPSVILTNGDNDTFPLWFVQEVRSTRYENNKKPYKAGVINANLSLLNTPWYIEKIKRKGAPVSFVYESKGEAVTLQRKSVAGGGEVWEGYVAHPPIKKRGFEAVMGGQTIKVDRKGKLRDANRKVIGRIELNTGKVTLNQPPANIQNDKALITVSYDSGEIENLPSHVFISRTEVVMLADIIIRDMLATNAGKVYADSEKVAISGFSTKIPIDYLLPMDVFAQRVLDDYKETIMPVYFSTTVSPSRVQSYAPYLIQEALAYRFRKAPREDLERRHPAINLRRSYEIFTEEIKLESILDPRVRRDDQMRGLFINYGIAMQEIAEQLVGIGQPQRAYDFVKVVDSFDVEPDVRRVFLMNLYVFARQAGADADADRYYKELESEGWLDTEFHIRQGMTYARTGDTALAEEELKRAYAKATSENPQGFLSLFMFYMEITKNPARARELVEDWNVRFPGHELSFRLYLDYLEDPAAALRVLDQIIRTNPGELQLIQLRDSLKAQYNL